MMQPNSLGAALARTLSRLVLLAVAAVFALVMLALALIGLVFILLKALVTWRKPEFVTTFVRFRQASQQFRQAPPQHEASPTGTVIEGQAVEIRDDTALPHPRDADEH